MSIKNKIYGILMLASIMVICQNCNEDELLSKYPKDAVNTGNYFVDASSARSTVAAVFANWNKRYSMYQRYMLSYLDILTDDAYTRIKDHRALLNNYTFTEAHTSQDPFKDWWIYIFRSINDANFCIEYIPTSSSANFTEEQQRPYIAAARFMRAFSYIYLTSLYGDVPLHRNFISNTEDSYKAKSPVSEIYTLIIEDLLYAREYLPEQWPSEETGFPVKAAGAGMLARAYLYNKDYANAEAAALRAIEIADESGYELMDDYEYMMSYESQPNKEFIFAINFLGNDDWSKNGNMFEGMVERLPRGGDSPNGPTLGPTLYAVMGGDGWGYIMPTRDLYDEFETGDPRRKYSMWVPGDFYGIHEGETATYTNPYTGITYTYEDGDTIYYQEGWSPSFMNTRKVTTSIKGQSTVQACGYDIPILRYAELLLYYAEALIENGKIDEGLAQVNLVRSRLSVNMPAVSASNQQDARALLRHERRIELNLEGIRIFDIRRWGIVEEVLGASANSNKVLVRYGDDTMYKGTECEFPQDLLLPIPISELDINDKLDQNPGY
ncbi:MAG: RagB/SusD family nutrient uptake outer membrane protein [Bacteroidales bacterium]|nr:RagB/SusD family nutrient uptake outer membrane protein [Bacteroidales bacterium]